MATEPPQLSPLQEAEQHYEVRKIRFQYRLFLFRQVLSQLVTKLLGMYFLFLGAFPGYVPQAFTMQLSEEVVKVPSSLQFLFLGFFLFFIWELFRLLAGFLDGKLE